MVMHYSYVRKCIQLDTRSILIDVLVSHRDLKASGPFFNVRVREWMCSFLSVFCNLSSCKKSGMNGNSNPDLFFAGAALYQLSYQVIIDDGHRCVCCGLNLSLVPNFKNWLNLNFPWSCIYYHNRGKWQIKLKPVQKNIKSRINLNHNIYLIIGN